MAGYVESRGRRLGLVVAVVGLCVLGFAGQAAAAPWVYVAPNASDATSGVASSSCGALNTSSVGDHTVTCTASDVAGNTASVTLHYLIKYVFSGFQAPINSEPTVNTGRAGRAYPVKFQLTDAGGRYISALTAVQNITYNTDPSGIFSNDPTDPLEATATGSSGLHYDVTANQYIYNWANPRDCR